MYLSKLYKIEHVKCCLFIVYTYLVNYNKVGSIGILSSCASSLRWFKVTRTIAVKVYSIILLVSSTFRNMVSSERERESHL